MLTNLFSSFDPQTCFFFPLMWISLFSILLFIPLEFNLTSSRLNYSVKLIWFLLTSNFKSLLNKVSYKFVLVFLTLFMAILSSNFFGLLPYVFTPTSHLSVTLTVSMSIWLGFSFYSIFFKTFKVMAHLVPAMTPSYLIFVMVVIETISFFIRPVTLAVRLAANMIAGHLLMTLLSDAISFLQGFKIFPALLIQVLLIILELAVSFIQAYVFSMLMLLYVSES